VEEPAEETGPTSGSLGILSLQERRMRTFSILGSFVPYRCPETICWRGSMKHFSRRVALFAPWQNFACQLRAAAQLELQRESKRLILFSWCAARVGRLVVRIFSHE